MKQDSLNRLSPLESTVWSVIAPKGAIYPALEGSHHTDVVIIDGGITGMSTALYCAQLGIAATVLEAREPGFGASGRSAGHCAPMWASGGPETAIAAFGSEAGAAMNEMLRDSGELVAELLSSNEIEASYRPGGIFLGADTEKALTKMKRLATAWRQLGNPVDSVGPEEIQEKTGASGFLGGIVYRNAGAINSLAFTRGLARAATKFGGRIHSNSKAVKISQCATGWRVETAVGSIEAKNVVIATQALGSTLWPGLKKLYYQVPYAGVATDRLQSDVLKCFGKSLPVTDRTADASLMNVHVTADGRIAGSVPPTVGGQLDPHRLARPLEKALRKRFPELRDVRWTKAWNGNLSLSADKLPRLVQMAEGVLAPVGYSGLGITVGTAIGKEIAKLVYADGTRPCRMPISTPKPVPLRGFVSGAVSKLAFPALRTFGS